MANKQAFVLRGRIAMDLSKDPHKECPYKQTPGVLHWEWWMEGWQLEYKRMTSTHTLRIVPHINKQRIGGTMKRLQTDYFANLLAVQMIFNKATKVEINGVFEPYFGIVRKVDKENGICVMEHHDFQETHQLSEITDIITGTE